MKEEILDAPLKAKPSFVRTKSIKRAEIIVGLSSVFGCIGAVGCAQSPKMGIEIMILPLLLLSMPFIYMIWCLRVSEVIEKNPTHNQQLTVPMSISIVYQLAIFIEGGLILLGIWVGYLVAQKDIIAHPTACIVAGILALLFVVFGGVGIWYLVITQKRIKERMKAQE